MRAVATAIGRLEGKIDILSTACFNALGKLPNWWQLPAVIGATIVLLGALATLYRYLQMHGAL